MDHRGALLRLAIPMLALKIWFAILLLTYAPTRDTALWIAATHWPLIIIMCLLAGPCVAGYRLLKARIRRGRLRRAEFMVADPAPRRPRRAARLATGPQCSALWETVSRLEGDS
jgi:hypothetical protein